MRQVVHTLTVAGGTGNGARLTSAGGASED
jgi:hypothetical protein